MLYYYFSNYQYINVSTVEFPKYIYYIKYTIVLYRFAFFVKKASTVCAMIPPTFPTLTRVVGIIYIFLLTTIFTVIRAANATFSKNQGFSIIFYQTNLTMNRNIYILVDTIYKVDNKKVI